MDQHGQKSGSIEDYRATYKELDRIWSLCSKACGISDAEYWALLMIREGFSTQTEISDQLSMNKQTVHSALKQLVKKGMARLEIRENNLRVKQIFLTECGEQFVKKHVDRMLHIEEKVWDSLGTDERTLLIKVSNEFNRRLESELQTYLKTVSTLSPKDL